MRCNECRRRLLAGSPGEFATASNDGTLTAHLASCRECASFLKEQQRIARALKYIAAETGAPALSGRFEGAIAEAFDRSTLRRGLARFRPRLRFALIFASAIALLVLGFVLAAIHRMERRVAPVERAKQAEPERFVAVPYAIPPAPYERTEIVRMQVSLAALRALGFQVHTPEMGGSVAADVLCGQDGRVVAIAVLPDSAASSTEKMEE